MLNGINNENSNLNNLINTQLTEQTGATGVTNPITGNSVNPYEQDRKNFLIDETIISNDAMKKYMEEIIAKQNKEFERQTDIKNFTNLVMNTDKAFIWNLFFNKCHFKSFSKKDLTEQISELLEADNYEFNEKVLADEISVLLKTYTIDENEGTPEDNFICPLTELKLIKKIGKNNYQRENTSISNLSKYIVYWCMLQQTDSDNISIDDLVKGNNSVCNLLNIDKITLNEYLDILKKNGFITINRTAGLNMIYFNKKITLEDIYKGE